MPSIASALDGSRLIVWMIIGMIKPRWSEPRGKPAEHKILCLVLCGRPARWADGQTRQHWHAPIGDRRTKDQLNPGQRDQNRLYAGLRALIEQSISHPAGAWALRRWRGLLYRVSRIVAGSSALVAGSATYPPEAASRTPWPTAAYSRA